MRRVRLMSERCNRAVLEELHLQRQPQNVMLEANPRFLLELEALLDDAVRPCDILRENCV